MVLTTPRSSSRQWPRAGSPCGRVEPDVYAYEYRGVQVEALDFATLDERRDYLVRRIEAAEPDWVLVTDDKRRFMLDSALRAAPGRVILLLQTIVQLPFGPVVRSGERGVHAANQAGREDLRDQPFHAAVHSRAQWSGGGLAADSRSTDLDRFLIWHDSTRDS